MRVKSPLQRVFNAELSNKLSLISDGIPPISIMRTVSEISLHLSISCLSLVSRVASLIVKHFVHLTFAQEVCGHLCEQLPSDQFEILFLPLFVYH